MKKILVLAFLLVSAFSFGQTYQFPAVVAINAGQCVEMLGQFAAPCDNTTGNPYPVLGVALNSVAAAPPRTHTLVSVQLAGVVQVPNTSSQGVTTPGDFVGDIDGTGNLSDLGVPSGGQPFCTCNGAFTYAGVYLGGTATTSFILVQPGYVPTSGVVAAAFIASPKTKPKK